MEFYFFPVLKSTSTVVEKLSLQELSEGPHFLDFFEQIKENGLSTSKLIEGCCPQKRSSLESSIYACLTVIISQ